MSPNQFNLKRVNKMKYTKENRFSASYRGTIVMSEQSDRSYLNSIRSVMSENGTKRVVLAGRLGQNNPNSWKYKIGKVAYQWIRKEDAASFDIYVYDK